jgi:phosphonopyruvate decarboxylase
MRELIIGIPDKLLVKWLGKKKYIAPADEGEAIGIACGYYLAKGKPATVFMSADGFCNALNPLTSYVIPAKVKMNLVISTGRQELQHKIMSDSLERILDAIDYDPKILHIKIIQKK